MKNLKPFKKGDDPRRNLKGRPKSLPPLDAVLLDVLGDRDRMKKIVEAIAKRALRGNLKAGEFLIERVYGKLKTLQEHSGSVDLLFRGLTAEEIAEFVTEFKAFKKTENERTEPTE